MKRDILFLTDHTAHSRSNSLYLIVNSVRADDRSARVYISSRKDIRNTHFFENGNAQLIFAVPITEFLSCETFDAHYTSHSEEVDIASFDVIMLRLPRPISDAFLLTFESVYHNKIIVNSPSGIVKTSNKAYLLNFKKWCPDIQLCDSKEDIMSIYQQFPIVLKPLREYGGKGIIRIEDDQVHADGLIISLDEWLEVYSRSPRPYLAMRFLKNVSKGDKRIVVANGRIIGCSLRIPAEGGWLCNVAQGGHSVETQIEPKELKIVEEISPILIQNGIFLYGLDTLTDDDGSRVISEINTLSVGGIVALEKLYDRPAVDVVVSELFDFIDHHSAV